MVVCTMRERQHNMRVLLSTRLLPRTRPLCGIRILKPGPLTAITKHKIWHTAASICIAARTSSSLPHSQRRGRARPQKPNFCVQAMKEVLRFLNQRSQEFNVSAARTPQRAQNDATLPCFMHQRRVKPSAQLTHAVLGLQNDSFLCCRRLCSDHRQTRGHKPA